MRKRFRQKQGSTLVELLVTFALFSIFMASAVAMITPCTNIFLRVKYLTYAQNVGDMVMEKVTGEISSASEKVVVDNNVDEDGYGKLISLTDNQLSPLYIGKNDDSLLRIHYREIRLVGNGSTSILWPAAEWGYDVKAYQGYVLKDISFKAVGEKDARKSVEVKITIENEARNTTYTSAKVIECYNLPTSEIVKTEEVYVNDDSYYDHE